MASNRVRNLVIIVVLIGWGATVGTSIVRGEIPDAPLLGVPGAVWLALHPPRLGGRDQPPEREPPAAPPAPTTDRGGTPA